MSVKHAVLIAVADNKLRTSISQHLEALEFAPVVASDGISALEVVARQSLDLALIDLELPIRDGIDVCAEIRATSPQRALPILFKASHGAVLEIVLALNAGADDYIVSPFQLDEVRTRLRVLARRRQQAPVRPAHVGETMPTGGRVLTVGDIRVDLDRRTVQKRGQAIVLKKQLFDLLVCLMLHRGKVLTREQIMAQAWDSTPDPDSDTVAVHIRWLREKIEDNPSHPTLIQTVHRVGYRFADPDAADSAS
jgi:two-component system, OmpR family, alkaline phosphatase synthesis response regulator PhoP